MISHQYMADHPEVDWSVYNRQQNLPSPSAMKNNAPQNSGGVDSQYQDTPLGQRQDQPEKWHGFFDYLTRPFPDPNKDPSMHPGTPEWNDKINSWSNTFLNEAALGPGMNIIGSEAPSIISGTIAAAKGEKNYLYPKAEEAAKATKNYLFPGQTAEAYRSTFGQGTSSENIAELSKRAQFAKQSTQNEALIPKDQYYGQVGRSDVYDVNQANLPEGNIGQFAQMIDPDFARTAAFGKASQVQDQATALSKALQDYRAGKVTPETGGSPLDSFLNKAEDIFNLPELDEKAASRIEDVLSMPTKRDSAYFSDPDVTTPYSSKGKIMELHNQYEADPIMNNYQNLRSALTTEMRKLKPQAVNSDVASQKLDQISANVSNLDKDASAFNQTLPENLQNLDSEFRQKYSQFGQTYNPGIKGVGPSKTLQNLANGRSDQVDDAAVRRMFSKPTAADTQAILDMGPSAGRQAIYAALQRVAPGDAEGMAKTLLKLKRTTGFDKYITPDMEQWSNNMLSQVRKGNMIKKGIGAMTGAGIGAAVGGPVGAAIGFATPWAKEYAPGLGKILASKLKK